MSRFAWTSVTDSSKTQIKPACEQDFKLNVEHGINIHDVRQFVSEVCNVFPDANWTRDVFGQASVECGANLLMYSVRRVATDKFGCRVIRRLFVGVLSNEDAVLRVAGSAKTVSQPILPENRTELGRARGDNSWIRYDVRGTEKLVRIA